MDCLSSIILANCNNLFRRVTTTIVEVTYKAVAVIFELLSKAFPSVKSQPALVVLVGDRNAGKTTFVNKFVLNQFSLLEDDTFTEDMAKDLFKVNGTGTNVATRRPIKYIAIPLVETEEEVLRKCSIKFEFGDFKCDAGGDPEQMKLLQGLLNRHSDEGNIQKYFEEELVVKISSNAVSPLSFLDLPGLDAGGIDCSICDRDNGRNLSDLYREKMLDKNNFILIVSESYQKDGHALAMIT